MEDKLIYLFKFSENKLRNGKKSNLNFSCNKFKENFPCFDGNCDKNDRFRIVNFFLGWYESSIFK